MDIAGLSKLTADTLVLVVSILGFMVIIVQLSSSACLFMLPWTDFRIRYGRISSYSGSFGCLPPSGKFFLYTFHTTEPNHFVLGKEHIDNPKFVVELAA